MTITEKDFEGINTYGIPLEFGKGEYVDVNVKNVLICITKRPFYCDRGRFGVWIGTKPGCEPIMTIDAADGFPRYFFSLQRLFDELKDWIDFNEENLNK